MYNFPKLAAATEVYSDLNSGLRDNEHTVLSCPAWLGPSPPMTNTMYSLIRVYLHRSVFTLYTGVGLQCTPEWVHNVHWSAFTVHTELYYSPGKALRHLEL